MALYSVSSAPYTVSFLSTTCEAQDPVAILLVQLSTACQNGGDYSLLIESYPDLTKGWTADTAGYQSHLPCASLLFAFFNIVADCTFFMDIFLNFLIGYVPQRSTVTVYDPKKIAVHYLRGSFAVDLIATVPWEPMFRAMASNVLGIRLVGLFRMFRLLKLQRKMSTYLSSPWVRMCSLFAGYLLCAHLLACMLFFIGRWQALDLLKGDTQDYAGDPWTVYTCIQYADSSTQYNVSLYWAVTTITTVGYGDIVPITNTDKAVVMLAMFFSGVLQAVFLANFALIVEQMTAKSTKLSARLDEVSRALQFHNVPYDLQQRVHDSIEYYWTQRYGEPDRRLLSTFNARLRADAAEEVLESIYRNASVLSTLSGKVCRDLALHWTMKISPPGETILHSGEPVLELMHVQLGACTAQREGVVLDTVPVGDTIGLLDALLQLPSSADIVSTTYCTLYCLPVSTLLRTLQAYPDERAKVMSRARKEHQENRDAAMAKLAHMQIPAIAPQSSASSKDGTTREATSQHSLGTDAPPQRPRPDSVLRLPDSSSLLSIGEGNATRPMQDHGQRASRPGKSELEQVSATHQQEHSDEVEVLQDEEDSAPHVNRTALELLPDIEQRIDGMLKNLQTVLRQVQKRAAARR